MIMNDSNEKNIKYIYESSISLFFCKGVLLYGTVLDSFFADLAYDRCPLLQHLFPTAHLLTELLVSVLDSSENSISYS